MKKPTNKIIRTVGTCLIEGCDNTKLYARGVCHSHYKLIARTVKEGLHTWEEFEDFGMSLPSEQGRTSESSKKFHAMLEKREKLEYTNEQIKK